MHLDIRGYLARFLACVAIPLFSAHVAFARDYYVAKTGSDTNVGTLDQPFLTIQRAANVMVAGDTAYIRAGVYRETVRPANSGVPGAPITFQPYNGESVTVSGADVIASNSWSIHSGNIYKTILNWDLGEGANQIFLDGQMMTEARWPNTTLDVSRPAVALTGGGSYIDEASGVATGTITGLNLPSRPAGYWAGATIHISPFNVTYNQGPGWSWQTGTVVSSAATQLSFTWSRWVTVEVPNPLVPGPKNPYYLTGKLGELDAAAEWFLDSATSTLYFWTPAGDSPAPHLVEAKRRPAAFNLNGRSFVALQGLSIFSATITSDPQSAYLMLDGLNAKYVSHYSLIPTKTPQVIGTADSGILLNGRNNTLRNSTIAFSAGNGVMVAGTGHRVLNNVIHDADYSGGYPAPIGAAYRAASGVVIAWNTIYNAGRFGILHSAGNNSFTNGRILHNEISEYGLQSSDLGCTYTFGSDGGGTEVAYNVCRSNTPQNLLMGVYLDFDSSNVVVHHNLVWGTQASIRMNTVSRNNKIYNNTFAASLGGLIANPGLDEITQLPGSELKNNIFTRLVGANATAPSSGAVFQNNLFPATNPQFVDPAQNNYQLKSTSPAINSGALIPPYTDGFIGPAPDIGAYESGVIPWGAGAQTTASIVSAGGNLTWLAPGSLAFASAPGLTISAIVTVTDGLGVDRLARVIGVTAAGITFEIPPGTAAGMALVTITSSGGAVAIGSVPIFATYYFPHLALGGGWQTTLTYVNYSPDTVTCYTTFSSDSGTPLSVSFGGAAASTRTDTLAPGGTVHQQSQANLNAAVVTGWAQAECTGPVKASLLFRYFTQGAATGEAGVNAMTAPNTSFVSYADTQTGVAYANPSTQPSTVTITALNAAGQSVGSAGLILLPGQHGAAFVGALLNLTSFTGSIRISATIGIISLTLNFEAAPTFSSLPPGESSSSTESASNLYYFPHLALGGGWQTTLTYVNASAQNVTCQTSFFSDTAAPLPVTFGGTALSVRSDVLAPGGSIHQQSQASLNAAVLTGWAQAQCSGPVKASLSFRYYNQGLALGEAGVNAMTAAATQFATFGETNTGIAYANPSNQAATITLTALDSTGRTLGSKTVTLSPGQHSSAFMGALLGLANFNGSVQMTSTAPIISLSINFEAAPVFSSLPPGELTSGTALSTAR